METDALDEVVCEGCGFPEWWVDNGCDLCMEPPTDEACPDCRAEVGEHCTWACSSRWI